MIGISTLLERVERARGSDRELDYAICEMERGPCDFGSMRYAFYDPYTSNIDAALALVERLRPGEGVVLETHGINRAGIGQSGRNPSVGASPALAILAALLRSLIQDTQEAS